MFGVGRAADMAIVDTVWGRLTRFNAPRRSPDDGPSLPLRVATLALRWLVLAAILVLNAVLALGGVLGKFVTRLNRTLGFDVKDGQSAAIRFPKSGPYDERLGYAAVPDFINSLTNQRYGIE